MLETHAGWGMCIAFVPKEYLADEPGTEMGRELRLPG